MNMNLETNFDQWWNTILGKDYFFDLSLDLLCIARTDGYFHKINPAFQHVLGHTHEDFLSRPFVSFVHPEDVQSTLDEIEKLKKGIPTIQFENRYKCKDGTYKWLSWKCMPHTNGQLYAVARDVTTEKETQRNLRQSLREKEVLLKEIHHRVKNNLQVITSLINMQIRMLDDKKSKDALIECQSRIQAIALIHEKLYQSADYSRISFAEYVQNLINDIFHATGTSTNQIALELNIPKISLPIDKAIPCALILNELVTNSLKHGFPDQKRGVIGVSMNTDLTHITFNVRDSGIGLPQNMDVKKSPSLGLQLVCTLVEQLKADLNADQKEGTSFTIRFAR